MNKTTIKAYAVKHKLSIYNVMKMVKSGKVKSEVIEEDGREVTYIIFNNESENEIEQNIVPMNEKIDNNKILASLVDEVKLLRKEVESLKTTLLKS